ncbi:MAG: ABC transporter permease subunit [Herbiconiux sp.]|nr:ABC transporter permease subunit [Herbiconiux sp.]
MSLRDDAADGPGAPGLTGQPGVPGRPATGIRRRRRTRGSLAVAIASPLVLFAALAALWQWVAVTFPTIVPPLQDVAADLAARPEFFVGNALYTLTAAVIGFAIGTVVSIGASILMVSFRPARAAFWPLALLINVTPIVAIAPALQAAFGFTQVPNIVVAALSAVFPTMVNALAGLRAVDPQSLEVFQALSATRWDTFARLRLPSALPFLFAGAQLAVCASMIGSVVSEFIGATKGLGAAISQSTFYLNLTQLWGSIWVSALVTLILLGIVVLAQKLTVRW